MVKKSKKSGKKKFSKDDEAVSAVVGVILMVAITVVMAAIVSSWGSGVKAPASPPTVGIDISRNTYNITLTVTAIDPPSAAPLPNISAKYANSTLDIGTYTWGNLSNVNVGDSVVIGANESGPSRLIIVAQYKDGSKKVLYSQDT
ncbi:MAG: type IV pilin N-terminal domain-containing protein [Candidatus Methanoperedens sp.]|nr:type IV pilin N-terminal domain-containing protein [Candidatus Methanoperedens sp.]MCZ7371445.1 type IV pilin N-terminal domain-containing protein [Candidatus Methanoperedens sp.]